MNEIIKLANEKVSKFDTTDWALLKTAIMLVGVLIGCTFSGVCKKIKPLILISWITCFAYLMVKMFGPEASITEE
ncbi:MAG: hypothetical protein ATN33_00610 [Epulopiscium sp. Nele67-Bin001]|nr:MAG: hypothetical protein ATN33_00610 [Epulopiscium sp. Nele67-Bin001]